MKKQQLLALIMAGTIVTGMSPAIAFGEADTQTMAVEDETAAVAAEEVQAEEPAAEPAAEGEDTSAGDSSDSIDNGNADVPTDTPAAEPTQEPAADPTQEPTDTPAAEPTQEPADETPDEVFDNGGTEEMAETNTDAATEAVVSGKIVILAADGTQTPYNTLAEAIAAAPTVENPTDKDAPITQIVVTGTVELTGPITVDGSKNISIAAGEENTTIKRAAGASGDMFIVKDGSVLQFAKGVDATTGAEYALTVDASSTDVLDSQGSIVSVQENSTFGLNEKVTLTGNRTSVIGSAIRNEGGTIGLSGGTITENQNLDETNGASIYSAGNVLVSGTVVVSDNDNRSVLLDKGGYIHVAGVLTETSMNFIVSDAANQRKVIEVSGDPANENKPYMTVAEVLTQIAYAGDATYTVDENGLLKTSTTPVVRSMKLKCEKANGEGASWASDTEATVKFHATELGTYYITVIKQTDKMPTFAEVKKNKNTKTGTVGTVAGVGVALTGLDSSSDLYVVVYGEDSNGNESTNNLVLPLKARTTTPDEPTNTPTPTTRAPYTPAVTESTVTGLEKPLEFYPGKTYSFSVTGAGSDNKDPVDGDVRWVPLYWSSYKTPTSSQRQAIGTIGHKTGIKRAATFNMYIFFQKYVYDSNSGGWKATDIVESMTYQFKSKAIDFSLTPTVSITPTTAANNGSGGYDYSGDGSGDGSDDSSDPEDHDGDGSDTGSTSATNARTADNSPIATMMMLASLSLVAGGYVLVRKRKKEN